MAYGSFVRLTDTPGRQYTPYNNPAQNRTGDASEADETRDGKDGPNGGVATARSARAVEEDRGRPGDG